VIRLGVLQHGHRPLQKPVLAFIRRLVGQVPGPILTMSYRSEIFGKAFSASLQEGMRRAKHWSVAEVELFAAFVSNLNRCEY
jgi:hypothetical protein